MTKVLVLLCALAAPLLLPWRLLAAPAAEVPAGTHFLVELRDKLDAKKIKVGKKFKAETLEALQASDGNIVPAGAKLKGHVSFVEYNKMMLRFERIDPKAESCPSLPRYPECWKRRESAARSARRARFAPSTAARAALSPELLSARVWAPRLARPREARKARESALPSAPARAAWSARLSAVET